MILLQNLGDLTSPITGWDTLPAATGMSSEADVTRLKYFRNTVYAHAEQASVDDTTFNAYQQDIRDTLVRLGGVRYRAAIDNLEAECMDPEMEDHYRQVLCEWKKDEDNIKEEQKEIGAEIRVVENEMRYVGTGAIIISQMLLKTNSKENTQHSQNTFSFSGICHAAGDVCESCESLLEEITSWKFLK